MWLNMITVLSFERAAPYMEDPMQIGSRNETFKTKSFSKKYYSVFVFAGSTLEANKGKSECKRKCYNIVLLTRGTMRTVLQVSWDSRVFKNWLTPGIRDAWAAKIIAATKSSKRRAIVLESSFLLS